MAGFVDVKGHPDDADLRFMVPITDGPSFLHRGTADVLLPAGKYQGWQQTPWVAHCGCGFWLHTDDIEQVGRPATMPIRTVKPVRRMLAYLVGADVRPPRLVTEQHEADADYDYRQLTRRLLQLSDDIVESVHFAD